ncbi:MAG: hypothetical protein AAGK14_01660 [Verrucomicrobiota bacterium]
MATASPEHQDGAKPDGPVADNAPSGGQRDAAPSFTPGDAQPDGPVAADVPAAENTETSDPAEQRLEDGSLAFEVDDAGVTHIRNLAALRELNDTHLSFILFQLRHGVSVKKVVAQLREKKVEVDKRVNMQRFYRQAAQERWRRKYACSAVEADAIIDELGIAYDNLDHALISGLKQETFRLLIQDELDAARVKQFFELFLKEKTSALAQAKYEAERQARLEAALDAFAEHLDADAHADARRHYDALRAAVLEGSTLAETEVAG